MIGLLSPTLWIVVAALIASTNLITLWKTWSWRDGVNEKAILVARADEEKRVRKAQPAWVTQ